MSKSEAINELVLVKDKLMRVGLHRTAHLTEIAIQEAGWDIQGLPAPESQKDRQREIVKTFQL